MEQQFQSIARNKKEITSKTTPSEKSVYTKILITMLNTAKWPHQRDS